MSKKDTLSIAPYYGGKGRMAHFIVERLNYDDSDIFVTPFGGMCRVLLNKQRHKVECYNDYSSGLTALMRILSDPVKAVEFIHRLEDETVYSQEEFDKQKAIFDYAEKDYEMREWEILRQMLIDEERKIVDRYHVKELLDKITYETRHPTPPKKNSKKARIRAQVKVSDDIQAAFERWRQQLKDKEFHDKFQLHLHNWALAHMAKKEQGMQLPRLKLARSSNTFKIQPVHKELYCWKLERGKNEKENISTGIRCNNGVNGVCLRNKCS